MHPIICQIGLFTVYSYGLALVVAFFVGSYLAQKHAKRNGFDPQIIFNLLFIAFICGIIGSRLLYIVENLDYYLKNPVEMIMFQHGGLSWFGGASLGTVAAIIYIASKKLSIYKTLDLIIPFVALGQAIGRVGCLLNGCCYGKPSVFGLYFKVHDLQLIPTQIYSSLAALLIFIILRVLQDKPHKEGQILFTYFLLYSIKRFLIEFWRADNPIVAFGLTLFQIISVVIFFLALWKLIIIRKNKG